MDAEAADEPRQQRRHHQNADRLHGRVEPDHAIAEAALGEIEGDQGAGEAVGQPEQHRGRHHGRAGQHQVAGRARAERLLRHDAVALGTAEAVPPIRPVRRYR